MELQNTSGYPSGQEQSILRDGLRRPARFLNRIPRDTVHFSRSVVEPPQDSSLLARGMRALHRTWDSIRDSTLPDPNQPDQWGNTELHRLLENPDAHPAMVEKLLRGGW